MPLEEAGHLTQGVGALRAPDIERDELGIEDLGEPAGHEAQR